MNNFSSSLGNVAVDGGKLIILEDGYDIASVIVSAPYFGAENNADSTTEETDYFCDSYGNSYIITVYSSMYGGIDYEIKPEEIIDNEGLNSFKSNIKVLLKNLNLSLIRGNIFLLKK